MKLYYVIDVVEFKVASIHRSKEAADKASNSERRFEVRSCDCDEQFLLYTFYEPNTSSQPDSHFTDVLPESLCKFSSSAKPDYRSIAVERMNRRLNSLIKNHGVVEMHDTVSFMEAMESIKDEYSKSSVEPDMKGQPFTHYSVEKNCYGDPSIAYHVLLDLSNY